MLFNDFLLIASRPGTLMSVRQLSSPQFARAKLSDVCTRCEHAGQSQAHDPRGWFACDFAARLLTLSCACAVMQVATESDADDYKNAFRIRGDDQNLLVQCDTSSGWLTSCPFRR